MRTVRLLQLKQIMGFLATVFMLAGITHAQTFPDRPITIVVPVPPGGLVDASARLLTEPLNRVTGQSIIIDNRQGASGNIAYQYVAKSKPDGYTLLASYSGYHALLTVAMNVIAVHPSVPANNLKEFIAYAKANPGKLNYASQGNGSVSHIGTEIFEQATGIKLTHVPYKGSGQAIQDVLAGQVQVFITTPPSVMGHVQTGKLKALAVTGKARHPMMPNVPTVAEAGLPGFELESWVALYAPAGTPAAIVNKLTQDVKKALELPEAKQRGDAAGIEVRYLNPQGTDTLLKKEIALMQKAIKSANIKLD